MGIQAFHQDLISEHSNRTEGSAQTESNLSFIKQTLKSNNLKIK